MLCGHVLSFAKIVGQASKPSSRRGCWSEPPAKFTSVGADHAHLKSKSHRITTGHQRGPCRRADRLHVERFQHGPGATQHVELRRADLRAAVEAAIGVAKIIGQQVDDVGPIGGNQCGRQHAANTQQQGQNDHERLSLHHGSHLFDRCVKQGIQDTRIRTGKRPTKLGTRTTAALTIRVAQAAG